MNGAESPAMVSPPKGGWRKLLWLVVAFNLLLGFVFLRPLFESKPSLPKLTLADGRILQIEGVTHGTHHRIGRRSVLFERFGPWLPQTLRDWFAPRSPENTIDLDRPGLVVWVNALDPVSGTNVDCQGIRTEFVDRDGDLFSSAKSGWFGGQKFWRVGHVFYAYPRGEEQLTFRVTPWMKGRDTPVTAQFANPHVTQPANWSGEPLPQSKNVGPYQITLSRLNLRTNETKYWQTPSVWLEPDWELRRDGQAVSGWSPPEWLAEDATGNRGQQLGRHQPVLRFVATIYPTATNVDAAVLIGVLPGIDPITLTNPVLWNAKLAAGTNEFVALGICPPGSYTFSGGNFDPTGPTMGAVQSGAPSGWTSQSRRLTPLAVKRWSSHYTPHPTIYLRAPSLPEPARLGLRLRDELGRYWATEPEPQGAAGGVRPFLLKLPAGVTNVVPELVLLHPLEADFLVRTKDPSAR